ncbi:hypothetical protein [Campylobacter sp. RM16187]|uniref:hypothetical protein n=1 Tax=Campylobacter sp. RM16187 TaxID=1660063 RepID=UPI0021B6C6F2|nr:hypothetical protein [Campylobacter sp. RM16187]QKG28868.1 hypothetical protein CDOMF_0594 [Campylobacter sp. RM16187]
MKDAKFIIDHILNNPSYKELKSRSECLEFTKLLSLNHQRLIAFCYVKNNILFFALLHPLGLQELKRDNNISMIKGLLKIYCSVNKDSKLAQISDIKFFVTKNLRFKQESKILLKIVNFEKSKGEFINLAKNPQIHAKFEAIREKIKANLDANR